MTEFTAHALLLRRHIAKMVRNARHLQSVLLALEKLGPQGTWLGSRTLGQNTDEYTWTVEVSRLLALEGIAAKTGKGPGLMMAPHHGCHLAGRPDLVIGIGANFIAGEPDHQYLVGGHVFEMPDFNSRHDGLFFNSSFHIGLPGRLGTCHEKFDLLNRLKHSLLAPAPVYLIERDGYYSELVEFLTVSINKVVGARVSLADYGNVKFVDLLKTTPAEFVRMLLVDIGWEREAVTPAA